MEQGILYITSGDDPYYSDAIRSAKSAKRVMPDTPVAIVTDEWGVDPIFDEVVSVDNMKRSFEDKPKFMGRAPFEKTLFVDTDTFFVEPIHNLWSLLDYYDIAASHTCHRRYDDTIPAHIPEFNSGVILFRSSDSVSKALSDWNENYGRFESGDNIPDQPSFRYTIFKHEAEMGDIKFHTIPREYNCLINGPGVLRGPVKILHAGGDRKMEINMERVGKKLNKHVETSGWDKRVHFPSWWTRSGVSVWADCPAGDSVPQNAWDVFRRKGPRELVRKTVLKISSFFDSVR